MATHDAVARIKADALKALKETGSQIATQLGIEPPSLTFYFKDADYQQAQELAALAAFNARVLDVLQTQSQETADEPVSSTPIPQRRQHRPVVSQRDAG